MLTITNHTLVIDDQAIPLPRLTKPATVRVWRVLRPSGPRAVRYVPGHRWSPREGLALWFLYAYT